MEAGALLLLAALVTGVVLFVARPFEGQPASAGGDGHALSSLLAERDRILSTLQELDFDHALGKVPAEDYPRVRADLLQHGAEVLRRLDALAPQASPAGRGKSVESRLEDAAAAGRADAAVRPAPPSDDDLEDLIARRRTVRKEKTAGFCPACGRPALLSDRFCSSCGQALK